MDDIIGEMPRSDRRGGEISGDAAHQRRQQNVVKNLSDEEDLDREYRAGYRRAEDSAEARRNAADYYSFHVGLVEPENFPDDVRNAGADLCAGALDADRAAGGDRDDRSGDLHGHSFEVDHGPFLVVYSVDNGLRAVPGRLWCEHANKVITDEEPGHEQQIMEVPNL